MPTSVGPNTFGEENLVFGYDTGDTVNSYKGEPTTNFMPTVYRAGASTSGTDEIGDYFQGTITRIGCPNGTPINSGATYTFTIEIRADKTFNMSADSNQYAPENGGNDLNRVSVSYIIPNYTTPNEWEKYSTTVVMKTGLTNPTMFDFFIPVSFTGRMYYRNAQLEYKPHATQFTPTGTTRSATQGLIDLTGNSTLDLTNVSFDSDAQIEFDGTDDQILVTPQVKYSTGSAWTTELVFEPTTTGSWNGLFGGGLNEGGYWMFHGSQQLTYYEGSSVESGTRITYRPWKISDTFTLNEYHHLTIAYTPTSPGSGSFAVYYNGGEKVDTFNYGFYWENSLDMKKIGAGDYSRYGTNNVKTFKFYNRALTASEIKANYNAIKGRFNI